MTDIRITDALRDAKALRETLSGWSGPRGCASADAAYQLATLLELALEAIREHQALILNLKVRANSPNSP